MMDSFPQVHLGNSTQPKFLEQIDQQPNLHPITRKERESFQRRSPSTVFARKRLDDSGKSREKKIKQWTRGQLCYPAAPACLYFVPNFQWAAVKTLNKMDFWSVQ